MFGVPLNTKAVNVQVMAKDSASHGTAGLYMALGPTSTSWWALTCRPKGEDLLEDQSTIITTYLSGSTPYLYHRINASGTSTMDVWIRIWGYFI